MTKEEHSLSFAYPSQGGFNLLLSPVLAAAAKEILKTKLISSDEELIAALEKHFEEKCKTAQNVHPAPIAILDTAKWNEFAQTRFNALAGSSWSSYLPDISSWFAAPKPKKD